MAASDLYPSSSMSTVLLTDNVHVPIVTKWLRECEEKSIAAKCEELSESTLSAIPARSVGFLHVIVSEASIEQVVAAITKFLGILSLSGTLVIRAYGPATSLHLLPEVLSSPLMLGGFLDVATTIQDDDSTGPVQQRTTIWSAKAPSWEPGAAARLPRRAAAAASASSASASTATSPSATVPTTTTMAPKRVVLITSQPGSDDYDGMTGTGAIDLIDEDALLESDTFTRSAAASASSSTAAGASATDGCGSKRRACKNCTCGRKEEEAAGGTSGAGAAATGEHKSACGNCWKGDAFRCSGCPFLGKPAFQPGTNGAVLLDTSGMDM